MAFFFRLQNLTAPPWVWPFRCCSPSKVCNKDPSTDIMKPKTELNVRIQPEDFPHEETPSFGDSPGNTQATRRAAGTASESNESEPVGLVWRCIEILKKSVFDNLGMVSWFMCLAHSPLAWT